MQSKYIPASLEASEHAVNLIEGEIKALEELTSTRKPPSLQDKLNKDRLQYLLYDSHLNEDQMATFGTLLDPKQFSKVAKSKLPTLNKLKKADLVLLLAQTQLNLEIERGYAVIAARTLDYLWHKFDGTEYKKVKQSQNRQKGREEIFSEDNKRLEKCLANVRKRIMKLEKRALVSTDYIAFRAEVYLLYPERLEKQNYRIAGKFKSTDPKDIAEDRKDMADRDPGWPETRLRDYFENQTRLKACKKYSRA